MSDGGATGVVIWNIIPSNSGIRLFITSPQHPSRCDERSHFEHTKFEHGSNRRHPGPEHCSEIPIPPYSPSDVASLRIMCQRRESLEKALAINAMLACHRAVVAASPAGENPSWFNRDHCLSVWTLITRRHRRKNIQVLIGNWYRLTWNTCYHLSWSWTCYWFGTRSAGVSANLAWVSSSGLVASRSGYFKRITPSSSFGRALFFGIEDNRCIVDLDER